LARPVTPFFFDLTPLEIEEFQTYSTKILASGNLILGEFTERFERAFADYVGSRHAIAVNTGSTALEILCRLKNVESRRVLVPTNTNFATVAAVLRAGGEVVYLDMEPETFAPTLSMVRDAIERVSNCTGVLWVHIGGIISQEFPEVVRFCRARGLFVVEDAAHAHGSELDMVKAGRLADGAAFSFFATKVMTTGEGGMITTDSDDEAYLAQSLRNQGKRGTKFGGLHHDFGNSSRMTELQCALGLIQLRKLPAMLGRRAVVYDIVSAVLDANGIRYCSTRHMSAASNYKLIVLLPQQRSLDEVKNRLKECGVVAGGGVYELPCHRQPVFQQVPHEPRYAGADTWCPQHLCPPITSGMTGEDAVRVGEAIVAAVTR
jgi:dTDP-4-amino-4,6-dideoxygalactose transaminase